MTNKKDDKVKIEVSTYNWGPCVVKVKILDDFKNYEINEWNTHIDQENPPT